VLGKWALIRDQKRSPKDTSNPLEVLTNS
jgi:hypothetical protein